MPSPIKEYLVSLGFKVDEASWSKFTDGLARAEAKSAELGLTVAGTATAVAAAIQQISRQYTDLYYVAQRTNSSIVGLKAFEFAGAQIGVSYDRARGAVEGFAASVRMNPGLSGLLKGMNIDPNDAQKASSAFIGRLKQQFGEGGYFVAARVAQMYGLDEGTFRQLWTNYDELTKKQAEYQRRVQDSGLNMEDLARKSRDLTNANAGLSTSLELILSQTADKWLPSMTETVKWLDGVAHGLTIVSKNTDGWSSTIISLVAAFGSLKIAALALSFIPGFGKIAAILGAPAGILGGATGAIAGAALLGSTTSTAGPADDEPMSPAYRKKHGAPSLMNYDPTSRREQAINYFTKQGWTRQQASGIAANLFAESGFNTTASGDGGSAVGIGQWHQDRQANFKRVFGKDLRDATFEEQLAFVQWELNNTEKKAGDRLRGADTARQAGGIVSSDYERPANRMGAALTRGDLAQKFFESGPLAPSGGGGSPVSIDQKTDIHVHASDPAAAAKGVADAQSRVNGDLVRNTQGAVR